MHTTREEKCATTWCCRYAPLRSRTLCWWKLWLLLHCGHSPQQVRVGLGNSGRAFLQGETSDPARLESITRARAFCMTESSMPMKKARKQQVGQTLIAVVTGCQNKQCRNSRSIGVSWYFASHNVTLWALSGSSWRTPGQMTFLYIPVKMVSLALPVVYCLITKGAWNDPRQYKQGWWLFGSVIHGLFARQIKRPWRCLRTGFATARSEIIMISCYLLTNNRVRNQQHNGSSCACWQGSCLCPSHRTHYAAQAQNKFESQRSRGNLTMSITRQAYVWMMQIMYKSKILLWFNSHVDFKSLFAYPTSLWD